MRTLLFLLLSLLAFTATAQKVSFRDSTDNAFDMSDWVINMHGFIPVPMLITEPAVGFGGALAAVMIKPRPQPAAYKNYKHMARIPPDITGGLGMYTASGSWAAFAARSGTFIKAGISYKAATGYMDLNLSFYPEVKGEEKEVRVNIKSIPAFVRGIKQLGYSNFHAGLQYTFARTTAKLLDTPLLDSIFGEKELDNVSSVLGIVWEFDNRDNVFTPNRGIRAHIHANWSDDAIGSDFDYVNMEGYAYQYIPIGKKWVSGIRGEMDQVLGDAPFYLLPSINLRGIPKGRYQGKVNATLETEQRWNFLRRWAAVAFGGTGIAFNEYDQFSDATWSYSFGVGGRYLLARKLNLYMGADVARGPEQWGFYIQFGSAWMR